MTMFCDNCLKCVISVNQVDRKPIENEVKCIKFTGFHLNVKTFLQKHGFICPLKKWFDKILMIVGPYCLCLGSEKSQAHKYNSYFCICIETSLPLIGHLTDNHLVDFLERCRKALRPKGLIVIKDNVAYEGVVPDEVDSSICRDLEILQRLVSQAGLRIIHQEQQINFPKEIYHVHMLALRQRIQFLSKLSTNYVFMTDD